MYIVSRVIDVKRISVDWVYPLLEKPPLEDHEGWAIYGHLTLHLTNDKNVLALHPTEFMELKPVPSLNAQVSGISWLSNQDSIEQQVSSSPEFDKMWRLLIALKVTIPPEPTFQDLHEPEKMLASARRAMESIAAQKVIADYKKTRTFQGLIANPKWLVLPEIKNTVLFKDSIWMWTDPFNLKDIFAFFDYVSKRSEPFDEVIVNESVHDDFLAFRKNEFGISFKRPKIPEFVRHEVWRRDQGKCVACGSKEKLEFDHVIPYSRGGSGTARNIQLLCEACNRQKSARI